MVVVSCPVTVKGNGFEIPEAESPVTVRVLVPLLQQVMGLGLNEQVTLLLPVLHASVIWSLYRLLGPMLPIVNVVLSVPMVRSCWYCGTVSEKPETPIPVKETDCGLGVKSPVKLSVPLRVPVVVGVKVTAIVQKPFTWMDD